MLCPDIWIYFSLSDVILATGPDIFGVTIFRPYLASFFILRFRYGTKLFKDILYRTIHMFHLSIFCSMWGGLTTNKRVGRQVGRKKKEQILKEV